MTTFICIFVRVLAVVCVTIFLAVVVRVAVVDSAVVVRVIVLVSAVEEVTLLTNICANRVRQEKTLSNPSKIYQY